MTRDEHRRRLAELYAADREKRRVAEAEIARKEAALAREQEKLARINAQNDELEAELDDARQGQEGDDGPAAE